MLERWPNKVPLKKVLIVDDVVSNTVVIKLLLDAMGVTEFKSDSVKEVDYEDYSDGKFQT